MEHDSAGTPLRKRRDQQVGEVGPANAVDMNPAVQDHFHVGSGNEFDDLQIEPVPVQAVRTRVSLRRPDPSAIDKRIPLPPVGRSRPAPLAPSSPILMLPLLVLVLVLVGVEVGAAASIVFLVLSLLAARRFVLRSDFSFGRGFLPYQGDPRWPIGVQEDDDFRWQWARGGGHRQH